MDLKLTFFDALCDPSTFKINGIDADANDFGEWYDRNKEEAPDYGCGDMQFTRYEVQLSVLKKYSITEEEFNDICNKLEEGLSFGRCGMCI